MHDDARRGEAELARRSPRRCAASSATTRKTRDEFLRLAHGDATVSDTPRSARWTMAPSSPARRAASVLAIARATRAQTARASHSSRAREALDATRARAIGSGAGALRAIVADPATDRARCEQIGTLELGGAPDILVNNAGVFSSRWRIGELPPVEFARTLEVNLVRAVRPRCTPSFRAMRARGSGHIVTIGSIADRAIFPETRAYAASKFGLRALHEVLRAELRGTGVRATLVSPGPVDTALWDPIDPDTPTGFTAARAHAAGRRRRRRGRYGCVTRPHDVERRRAAPLAQPEGRRVHRAHRALRCPRTHAETLARGVGDRAHRARHIVDGALGCPVCRRRVSDSRRRRRLAARSTARRRSTGRVAARAARSRKRAGGPLAAHAGPRSSAGRVAAGRVRGAGTRRRRSAWCTIAAPARRSARRIARRHVAALASVSRVTHRCRSPSRPARRAPSTADDDGADSARVSRERDAARAVAGRARARRCPAMACEPRARRSRMGRRRAQRAASPFVRADT